MGFIEQIPVIGPAAYYILPFLLVLGIVVAVHEYGHYIVAKWCGVHSDVFSIGFGPELFGWNDSKGTRWKVCAIPLGGYVKFRGDMDAASAQADEGALSGMTEVERAASFPRAKLWKRACIVAAGPVFNFVLAVLIFAGVAMVAGLATDRPVIGEVAEESEAATAGFEPGDRVLSVDGTPVESLSGFARTLISDTSTTRDVAVERDGEALVLPFSFTRPLVVTGVSGASREAGIEEGDVILSIDGEPMRLIDDVSRIVVGSEGRALDVAVERDGETLNFEVAPREGAHTDRRTGERSTRWLMGIEGRSGIGFGGSMQRLGPIEALGHGVRATGEILGGSLAFIADIFRGQGDSADLGGPIRIAEVSGDAADNGFASLMRLTAIISASIGLINLFPIPVLDGGHLLFYAIEALRGRPLSERMQEIGLTIGLAMVVMLMVYATYNDVMRL